MSELNDIVSGNETNLYTNLNENYPYYYAREFTTDIITTQRQMTLDGVTFATVNIIGIPNDISPIVNEAIVDKNSVRRLYINSNIQLNEEDLSILDEFYGKDPYPIFTVDKPLLSEFYQRPQNNHYYCEGPPQTTTEFSEYRYVQKRHVFSNIVYDGLNKKIYQLVLPEKPILTLIMPENFIRTGKKEGYFKYENNLIVNVFSKYLLSSALSSNEPLQLHSLIDTSDKKLMNIVKNLFTVFGFHKIVTTPNQIYAFDKYLTFVVGSISNIVYP